MLEIAKVFTLFPTLLRKEMEEVDNNKNKNKYSCILFFLIKVIDERKLDKK